MKKIVSLLFIAFFTLAIVSCGGPKQDVPAVDSTKVDSTVVDTTKVAVDTTKAVVPTVTVTKK